MSRKEYLVLWEVSRKQAYIFESNKLRENKGASVIIENIITELPVRINKSYGDSLVYNGGGSSLYRFKTKEETLGFIESVSNRVLKEYPGVEIFMTYGEFDIAKEKVTDTIGKLYEQLERKKNRRENSGEIKSFGIERQCMSTGMAAVDYEIIDGEKRFYSEEIGVKLKENNRTTGKFNKLLPNYEAINEFEDLVRQGKNYLAVVHIDGNRMGVKFDQLAEHYSFNQASLEEDNNRYIEGLKFFSKNIEELFMSAFKHMTETIDSKANRDLVSELTNIDEGKFPLIPIIVAGDDITYVVNGQIAIDSARIFIDYVSENKVEIYKGQFTDVNACGGVAIVPMGYPFNRAYNMAEDLCDNCKRVLREDGEKDYSLLDWHIEQGEIFAGLEKMRREYYRAKDGKNLSLRPYYLNKKEAENRFDLFSWFFKEIYKEDRGQARVPRTKLKTLRDQLRMGSDHTEIYLKANGLDSYFSLPMNSGLKGKYCYSEDSCLYFDPIEAMDMYVELEKLGGSND